MSNEHQDRGVVALVPTPLGSEPASLSRRSAVILKAFAALNALVIFFGFIPALLSFTWPFSLPTPWHFWQGHGTPLGLPFWPALALALVCAANLIVCLRVLKREMADTPKRRIVHIALSVVCVLSLMMFSDRPGDYIENSLLRDAPEDIPMQVSTLNLEYAPLEVRITVTTDTVNLGELEAFYTEMQSLVSETVRRRRVRQHSFSVLLNAPSGDEVLSWSAPAIWLGDSYKGYGALRLWPLLAPELNWRQEAPSVVITHLPKTRLQQTIDTFLAANEIAKDLVDGENYSHFVEMPFIYGNEHPGLRMLPSGIEPGRVSVVVRGRDELRSSQATLIELEEHVRSIVQRHGIGLDLSINLWLSDSPLTVEWRSRDNERRGTLELRSHGGVLQTFGNVRIVDTQKLIDAGNRELGDVDTRLPSRFV